MITKDRNGYKIGKAYYSKKNAQLALLETKLILWSLK